MASLARLLIAALLCVSAVHAKRSAAEIFNGALQYLNTTTRNQTDNTWYNAGVGKVGNIIYFPAFPGALYGNMSVGYGTPLLPKDTPCSTVLSDYSGYTGGYQVFPDAIPPYIEHYPNLNSNTINGNTQAGLVAKRYYETSEDDMVVYLGNNPNNSRLFWRRNFDFPTIEQYCAAGAAAKTSSPRTAAQIFNGALAYVNTTTLNATTGNTWYNAGVGKIGNIIYFPAYPGALYGNMTVAYGTPLLPNTTACSTMILDFSGYTGGYQVFPDANPPYVIHVPIVNSNVLTGNTQAGMNHTRYFQLNEDDKLVFLGQNISNSRLFWRRNYDFPTFDATLCSGATGNPNFATNTGSTKSALTTTASASFAAVSASVLFFGAVLSLF